MSTKIYNSYILEGDLSIYEIEQLFMDIKEEIQKIYKKLLKQSYITFILEVFDRKCYMDTNELYDFL